jgi:hypothetical protein
MLLPSWKILYNQIYRSQQATGVDTKWFMKLDYMVEETRR